MFEVIFGLKYSNFKNQKFKDSNALISRLSWGMLKYGGGMLGYGGGMLGYLVYEMWRKRRLQPFSLIFFPGICKIPNSN